MNSLTQGTAKQATPEKDDAQTTLKQPVATNGIRQ